MGNVRRVCESFGNQCLNSMKKHPSVFVRTSFFSFFFFTESKSIAYTEHVTCLVDEL